MILILFLFALVFQLRGPYLARFELCSKLLEHKMNPVDIVGDISGLFVEYFRKFGHKQCTVSDLRGYLRLLDQDKLTDLATRLIKDVGISATSVPQSVSFRTHIYIQQF